MQQKVPRGMQHHNRIKLSCRRNRISVETLTFNQEVSSSFASLNTVFSDSAYDFSLLGNQPDDYNIMETAPLE